MENEEGECGGVMKRDNDEEGITRRDAEEG